MVETLQPHMEEGDVVIDSGNSFFRDTERRNKELHSTGLHFVAMGISGGEEGARHGSSLMPGAPRAAYDLLEPALTKTAHRCRTSRS